MPDSGDDDAMAKIKTEARERECGPLMAEIQSAIEMLRKHAARRCYAATFRSDTGI